MARIRTIKPMHWNDKELAKISLQAHLLWIATWNFSDDDGVFEGDPLLLKAQIFPRRTDITDEDICQWLDQLVKARFIIPFQYKGEGYYVSRTFKTHQRIDKPQAGIIALDELQKVFQEHSENCPRMFTPVEEGKGEEKYSKGGEGTRDHLFSESEIFDKKIFGQKLKGTQYETANVDYYHEVISNWSESKGARKKNWLSTAKNWMANDMTDGKFIDQNFKPPQNGASKTKSGTSGKASRESVNEAFVKFHKPKPTS